MTNTCKTIREFRSWLEENIAFLENVLLYGPPDGEDALYVSLQTGGDHRGSRTNGLPVGL